MSQSMIRDSTMAADNSTTVSLLGCGRRHVLSFEIGEFVRLRGRRWVVEGTGDVQSVGPTITLSCIEDDAQGEMLEVAVSAEVMPSRVEDGWETIGASGPDDPATFAAFLRTLEWNTATAAERDLFQAPFRAGIRIDPYQLLPLYKALRLPRVNLLIADDVGLGKTIEAGLIVRELLLRRRIDLVVVAAPPSMTLQWRDELEDKFGLSFRPCVFSATSRASHRSCRRRRPRRARPQ